MWCDVRMCQHDSVDDDYLCLLLCLLDLIFWLNKAPIKFQQFNIDIADVCDVWCLCASIFARSMVFAFCFILCVWESVF